MAFDVRATSLAEEVEARRQRQSLLLSLPDEAAGCVEARRESWREVQRDTGEEKEAAMILERSDLMARLHKRPAGERNGRLRKPARRIRTTPRPKRVRRGTKNGR